MATDKQEAIICDLDGTLASTDHRRHHVDPFCPSCQGTKAFGKGDLDPNCADCGGTGKKDKKKWHRSWPRFFDGIVDDSPVPFVRDKVLEEHAAGTTILLTSARPENTRYPTEWWLMEHKIPHHELFMRPDGDYRDDGIVKTEIYQNLIEPHYNVKYAIDDRPRVIEAWKALNIPVIEVEDPGLPPAHKL